MRMAVSSADRSAHVFPVDDDSDLSRLLGDGVDLLLINRELPYGFDETFGVEMIRKLRATHPQLKLMLVSNYADAQQQAITAGALPGFGKREIGTPRVTQLLRGALAEEVADAV
jgi:hypothetical protein